MTAEYFTAAKTTFAKPFSRGVRNITAKVEGIQLIKQIF